MAGALPPQAVDPRPRGTRAQGGPAANSGSGGGARRGDADEGVEGALAMGRLWGRLVRGLFCRLLAYGTARAEIPCHVAEDPTMYIFSQDRRDLIVYEAQVLSELNMGRHW